MHYKVALLSALALPASAAAHNGPHSAMGLLEGLEHLLGPGHLIGLAGAVAAAALLAFGGSRNRRTGRKKGHRG